MDAIQPAPSMTVPYGCLLREHHCCHSPPHTAAKAAMSSDDNPSFSSFQVFRTRLCNIPSFQMGTELTDIVSFTKGMDPQRKLDQPGGAVWMFFLELVCHLLEPISIL
ncbi:hypothetical protein K439DRAFT_1620697 [Ramaria rubella]|nr:hypothetical protein K439DRAFT_1620697 [Ramaria rubella]